MKYTYIDHNIVKKLSDGKNSDSVIQEIRPNTPVVSHTSIAEIFQQTEILGIKNDLKKLEEAEVCYGILEDEIKFRIINNPNFLSEYEEWKRTTEKYSELKEATFWYMFKFATTMNRDELLECIDSTLNVYRKKEYESVEGIQVQIEDCLKTEKILKENKFLPFNFTRHIRERLGSDPRKMNNIKPDEIFGEIQKLSESCKDAPIEHKSILNNLNGYDSLFKQAEYLNMTLIFIGYWADKLSPKTMKSILSDSAHIGMACYCDEFMTNDQRLSMRAKAIFNFLKQDVVLKFLG